MLIEFTGCTGAGKTTLSGYVIDALRKSGKSTVSVHSAVSKAPNESLRNIYWELRSLGVLITSLKRNHKFFKFAIKTLWKKADSKWTALNLFRSIMRKIGISEYHRMKYTDSEMVIMDEGPFHAAHQLFVHLNSEPSDQDLQEFLRLVPCPDYIVNVTAPKEIIMNRTLMRNDPPRRRGLVESLPQYVNQAYKVYGRVFSQENMPINVAIVDFSRDSVDESKAIASQVASQIIKMQANANASK